MPPHLGLPKLLSETAKRSAREQKVAEEEKGKEEREGRGGEGEGEEVMVRRGGPKTSLPSGHV